MNENQSTITRFYTKQEVADILRVSVRTVTRYMGYGLPYKKIRGTVRIPEDGLKQWLRVEGVQDTSFKNSAGERTGMSW